jgi:hypothetical protein
MPNASDALDRLAEIEAHVKPLAGLLFLWESIDPVVDPTPLPYRVMAWKATPDGRKSGRGFESRVKSLPDAQTYCQLLNDLLWLVEEHKRLRETIAANL